MSDAPPFDWQRIRRRIKRNKTLGFKGVNLIIAKIHGKTFRIAADRPNDPIQRSFRYGGFYEPDELNLLKAHFPFGGVFVDIGANVGNHSLFVGSFLQPSKIVLFEPNPEALKLLLANIVMNGIAEVCDLDHLGVGLGETPQEGMEVITHERNLGAAALVEGAGDIRIARGDDELENIVPDFIKIDVEGMEIGVLKGLEKTISTHRPMMMVEVLDTLSEAFHELLEQHDYKVISRIRRYKDNENFFVVPKEKELT